LRPIAEISHLPNVDAALLPTARLRHYHMNNHDPARLVITAAQRSPGDLTRPRGFSLLAASVGGPRPPANRIKARANARTTCGSSLSSSGFRAQGSTNGYSDTPDLLQRRPSQEEIRFENSVSWDRSVGGGRRGSIERLPLSRAFEVAAHEPPDLVGRSLWENRFRLSAAFVHRTSALRGMAIFGSQTSNGRGKGAG
jgi:hypothetical protein